MADLFALAVGLALPWLLGSFLVALAYGHASSRDDPPVAWIAGCGWFVGIFLTTLCMRAVSHAGIPLSLTTIGAPLAVATALAAWFTVRSARVPLPRVWRSFMNALTARDLVGLQRTLWLLLVAWLAFRFALLAAEVWWRPLYPWDAWTQWGTKARVWFELRSLVPFVNAPEWFAQPVPTAYFDAAPHYPATVPLFQVWSALVLGRWDDALVNFPWWVSGVAFALALYGGLVRLGFSRLVALIGNAMVMSMPIVNAHIALAGYADLPMAAYLTLGTLAALEAIRRRTLADAALALVLLVACVLVKNPGKAWMLVLLPGLLVAALPRHGLRLAGIAFAGAALAITVLARTGVRILGYQLSPQFAMPWNGLYDAYFSFANWNLLWYLALATVLLGWRVLLSRDVAPLTCIVAAGIMFLLVGFGFSNAGAWVEDQSTVNRATLHLAPLIAVWILVTWRAWHAARARSVAGGAPLSNEA